MGEPSQATQDFKFSRLFWNATGNQSTAQKPNKCYAEDKSEIFKSNTATPISNSEKNPSKLHNASHGVIFFSYLV